MPAKGYSADNSRFRNIFYLFFPLIFFCEAAKTEVHLKKKINKKSAGLVTWKKKSTGLFIACNSIFILFFFH